MEQTRNQKSFEEIAQNYWTKEKEQKLTANKSLFIRPRNASKLLRTLGLLNADASMSASETKKYLQINHMLSLLAPHLDDLAERHKIVRILDAGCGNSFLTFLMCWYLTEHLKKNCEIIGIDQNPKLINQSSCRSEDLGYSSHLKFFCHRLQSDSWTTAYHETFGKDSSVPTSRPHLLVALHACDTASDSAISLGITLKSDIIAVAPCCQRELASHWKSGLSNYKKHPLAPIFNSPHLRRETAAQMTDALRLLFLRSRGYEVTATEFVPSNHTPKNRLLLAIRRGNFSTTARDEYYSLKEALGGFPIALETLADTTQENSLL